MGIFVDILVGVINLFSKESYDQMTREQVNAVHELQTIEGIKVQTSWREISLSAEPDKKFVRYTYKGETIYSGEVGRNYFRSSIRRFRKDEDQPEDKEKDKDLPVNCEAYWLETRLEYICKHI